MTLIFNEIHFEDGLTKSFIIAAADRRITCTDGSHRNWQKLFPISYLNGAISYYGLAEFPINGRIGKINLRSWIPNFITRNANVDSMKSFCFNLHNEISQLVPPSLLQRYPSGFHICGYDKLGYPDFWSIKNYKLYVNYVHHDISGSFSEPSNDLRINLYDKGWDGKDPSAVKGFLIYRNGDIRTHGLIFSQLDMIFSNLSQFKDFNKIDSPQSYRDFVEQKFKILSYIYNKRTKEKIIGGDIDVLLLEKPKTISI